MPQSKERQPTRKPLPQAQPAQPEAEVKEFLEIGGSPMPGITLRQVLRGHTDKIIRIAWSPDGQTLASASEDKTIRLWSSTTGEVKIVLIGHSDLVNCIAWAPDSGSLVSIADDGKIIHWEVRTGKQISQSIIQRREGLRSIAWSPNGQTIAYSVQNEIRLKNFYGGMDDQVLLGHEGHIWSLRWSWDSRILASGSTDNTIKLWSIENRELLWDVQEHSGPVDNVAWSPQGNILASASQDRTIRIWETETKRNLNILEGHHGYVTWIGFSADGRILASKSQDGLINLWHCGTWKIIGQLAEPTDGACVIYATLDFHPLQPVLATLGENDSIIRVWDLDVNVLLDRKLAIESVRYTTAKLVLVGDSGVGKTGLGWRLAHGEFKEHSSTHGQQFWAIPQLGLKRTDGTECEAVLWDLAGQHVYRQIHSIFLENVAAALVLFDPSNRQDPLKGAQFWLEQLKGKGQLPPTVLVGARVDRGAPALSQQELDQFCQHYGIRGGYISTSAKSGEGLEQLLEKIKAQIPWEQMTATVTTVTFKRIKDYVLALKEKRDRKGVLVSPAALREQLQATDKDWRFTDAEMMTAVGHLETHGYVTILKSSDGETYILLTPDLLVGLASSIVLLADKNPRELGSVSETELLQGKIQFDELRGLEKTEQQILLDAAVLRFLEHSICFRETLGNDTLLIFPGLIKQKRPLKDDIPSTDDISYIVRGRVENLYPMLVVLLGYTPSFTRINQWQNQAQYEMGEGEICGFRMIEEREGEIELVLYYGEKMPNDGRVSFQELFEQFLYQHDVQVTRFPPVVCPKGHRQERATVIKRVREGKTFAFCDECGNKVDLPKIDEPSFGIRASSWLQREEATARLRNAYEVNLARIKSYRRGWATPRCYVSHVPEQAKWADRFVHDLNDAGVFAVAEASQVQADDWVIVLDTPAYKKAWQSLKEDARLVQARFNKSLSHKSRGE